MEVFDIDDYTAQLDNPENKLYIVTYDIVNDKTRYKVAKLLSKYGFRVQKSAFEIICNKGDEREVIRDIEKLVDKKDDLVRVYRLCGNDRIYSFGNTGKSFEEDVLIL